MGQSNFTTYLERNAEFAVTDARKSVPEIPFIPFKQKYVIMCIDPRVEPGAIVGVKLGEAIVARNVGGRITPAVIKDLLWILHLHQNLMPDADWFEIAVIRHTDCGAGLFAKDELRHGYSARAAGMIRRRWTWPCLTPAKTVAQDIQKLRNAPELQPTPSDHVRTGGYTYDLDSGKLTTRDVCVSPLAPGHPREGGQALNRSAAADALPLETALLHLDTDCKLHRLSHGPDGAAVSRPTTRRVIVVQRYNEQTDELGVSNLPQSSRMG
jgi:carbonic anhydrase